MQTVAHVYTHPLNDTKSRYGLGHAKRDMDIVVQYCSVTPLKTDSQLRVSVFSTVLGLFASKRDLSPLKAQWGLSGGTFCTVRFSTSAQKDLEKRGFHLWK